MSLDSLSRHVLKSGNLFCTVGTGLYFDAGLYFRGFGSRHLVAQTQGRAAPDWMRSVAQAYDSASSGMAFTEAIVAVPRAECCRISNASTGIDTVVDLSSVSTTNLEDCL